MLGLSLKARIDKLPQISTPDVSNVRSWHRADKLTEPKVRCGRRAEVRNAYLHPGRLKQWGLVTS